MIRLVSLACLLFCAVTSSISAQPSRLEACLMKMQKSPEVRQLMSEIEREGPIHIIADTKPLSKEFGAFWDCEQRLICVNVTPKRTEGELIGSILFEMHNALSDRQFQRLDELASRGQIDRDSYVRKMEYLEFQHSHKAAALAQAGIEKGIFPRDARLYTYPTFEEHFRMQQIGGHSYWIAKNYDQAARAG